MKLRRSKHLPPDGRLSIRANTSMLGSDMLSLEVMSHFLHPMPLDSAWKEEEYKEDSMVDSNILNN